MMYDIATRTQALALKLYGISNAEIQQMTGISAHTLDYIRDRAFERGLDPSSPVIRDKHVADAPRPGRARKQELYKEAVLALVRKDRYGREKSCNHLAEDLDNKISSTTVWRILKNAKMKKTKATWKPGLTARMKSERLAFCRIHAHWTLEDWKNVIWTDETGVVLGHRRGGYKLWRTPEERVDLTAIRERWKGYQEFMFWDSFSYNKKGPFHIWLPETAQEKKAAAADLEEMNAILEPGCRQEWELETGIRRLGLHNKPEKKPT